MSAAVRAPDVESAIGTLRARGLRISAARRLVVEALFASERPVRAEEIARGMGGRLPVSDLASVYRNLEMLEEIGLVRHMHLGHGPGLYELAGRAEREYVVCERCDGYEVLDAGTLDQARAAVGRATGYRARFTHFPIVGLCPRCAGAE